MNKKQVGAFLKVMSKDDMRPILMNAKVERYKGEVHLIATDGYKIAAVKLDEDAAEIEGKMIRREAIERWYKLATGKSRLTSEELVQVAAEDYGQHGSYAEGNYPNWSSLIPDYEPEDGQTEMTFNAEFFKIIQDLDGADAISVKLYGKLAPMVVVTERGTYAAMPMRKN